MSILQLDYVWNENYNETELPSLQNKSRRLKKVRIISIRIRALIQIEDSVR